MSASTSSKASTACRKDFILAKIRREEVEEENKAAARIAEREYEIEMAEREREMAERRHEIELFSKKRQIDLEKMHEENRKRLVEAKMQEVNLMDDESLLLETATNSSSKHGSIYSTKSENRVKDWVESVGSQKTAILTRKQKKSSACFDQAISSAAADAQNSNSIVQEQGNTVENHTFENHRSEMNDQNQQHLPQLISQPSDLIGNDDLIQQINQGSEKPELNNPISEVNNQNEGLPNNTLQFWQSLADQESAYYRGLFFQTNQPSLSLKGNAYANQPQNTGNLQTSSPAHDFSTAAYTPQHNQDSAFPADAQLNHLAAQLEANLPAASASPLHN